jgi:hypothetical protein
MQIEASSLLNINSFSGTSKPIDIQSVVREFDMLKQDLQDAKHEIAALKIREQEALKLHHLYRPGR